MAGYNTEAMMKELPAEQVDMRKPWVDTNPKLLDFLKHGTLTELADAVIQNDLPEPWWTVAAMNIPLEIMLTRGIQWMLAPPAELVEGETDGED